ncbi:MerR family DNA-binding transcriptional regulator [Nocardia nova]|uniref:MerR family DNA-binding transcriptional regulator n=2 Tax=Nocardia nova TaxID=37330 RepID=A0A2S6AJU8_9NOCA|nr:MerR family DNA-binding transcriptional regulator [Nocardia nova]
MFPLRRSKGLGAPRRGLLALTPRGPVQQPNPHPAAGPSAADKLDDDDYPAYSMGRAAEILGVTQAFLRSLDAAQLLTPQRSAGGHRRYSRYQLRIAARVRELVDAGNALDAACRIVILEEQLAEAQRRNTELQHTLDQRNNPTETT